MKNLVEILEKELNSILIQELENRIAKLNDCSIYSENMDILINSLAEEIQLSNLDVNIIIDFIKKNQEKIICFSKIFLNQKEIKALRAGISFCYAIYLIFLLEKTEHELFEYIHKKKISDSKEFVKELLKIIKDINT